MTDKKATRQPPRPSREQLAARRLQAVQRIIKGESPETVARDTGLHRSRIYSWLKSYKQQGAAGLRAKPPGRPTKLSNETIKQLITLIDGKSPHQLGLDGDVWSQSQLSALLKQEFGLAVSEETFRHLLEKLALSIQRPYERLVGKQSRLVQQWLQSDYLKLQRQATRQKARILFLSQGNLHVKSIYSLSATSPRGQLYFMCYKKAPTVSAVMDFVHSLLKITDRKILLVTDTSWEPPLSPGDRLTIIHLPDIEKKIEENKRISTGIPNLADITQWIFLLNQSVLHPDYPLSDFLSTLSSATGGSAIIFPDLRRASSPIRFSARDWDLNFLITLNKRVAREWSSIPWPTALKHPGEIVSLEELFSPQERLTNKFYLSYKQAGFEKTMALCFAGPNDTLCGLLLSSSDKLVSQSETREFLTALRPHLENAMALTVRLWHATYTAIALEEATDHLSIAAVMLDGTGKIIKPNHTALAMLEQKSHLIEADHELNFLHTDHQKQFRQAVNKAIAWRQEPLGNKPVEAMQFTYPDGDTLGVLVQPITPPSLSMPHSAVVSPHVVVYISDPAMPRPSPQRQLIRHLFNLSAREAHLTALLTSGHTLNEAAKIMNITETTCRTYLQHIYEKVGVNRQQDLIQRVMKSVAVLA